MYLDKIEFIWMFSDYIFKCDYYLIADLAFAEFHSFQHDFHHQSAVFEFDLHCDISKSFYCSPRNDLLLINVLI